MPDWNINIFARFNLRLAGTAEPVKA